MSRRFNEALCAELRDIKTCLVKAKQRIDRIEDQTMKDFEVMELIDRKEESINDWLKRLEKET